LVVSQKSEDVLSDQESPAILVYCVEKTSEEVIVAKLCLLEKNLSAQLNLSLLE